MNNGNICGPLSFSVVQHRKFLAGQPLSILPGHAPDRALCIAPHGFEKSEMIMIQHSLEMSTNTHLLTKSLDPPSHACTLRNISLFIRDVH